MADRELADQFRRSDGGLPVGSGCWCRHRDGTAVGPDYNDPDVLARAIMEDEVAKGIAAQNVTCTFNAPGNALCQLTLENVPDPIPAHVVVNGDGRSYQIPSSG